MNYTTENETRGRKKREDIISSADVCELVGISNRVLQMWHQRGLVGAPNFPGRGNYRYYSLTELVRFARLAERSRIQAEIMRVVRLRDAK